VSVRDEIFRSFAGLFALSLKFLQFFRLQCANDIKSRLVLEFLKGHLSAPSDHHGFFKSPIPAVSQAHLTVYSFLRRFSRWSIPRAMQNFPVVGPHTTTGAADCVFDKGVMCLRRRKSVGSRKMRGSR